MEEDHPSLVVFTGLIGFPAGSGFGFDANGEMRLPVQFAEEKGGLPVGNRIVRGQSDTLLPRVDRVVHSAFIHQ